MDKQIIKSNNRYIITDDNDIQQQDDFPAGFYKGNISQSIFGGTSLMLIPRELPEQLIQFRDGVISNIIADCDRFFQNDVQEKYNNISMPHQMGAILYGSPGTGKTSTCLLLSQILAENHDCITVDLTSFGDDAAEMFLSEMRKLTEKPIVALFDEFEGRARRPSSTLLHMMDGSLGIQNLMILGCTNHIDEIAEKIKYRKSRVKHVYEVESLPIAVYKDYISNKLAELDEEEVSRFAYLCEDNSIIIDDLKHIIIDVYIHGVSIEDAIEDAKKFRGVAGDSDIDQIEL